MQNFSFHTFQLGGQPGPCHTSLRPQTSCIRVDRYSMPPIKVKVNIITGALGSGKTSFISSLIRAKSNSDAWRDERWSVLVNEFGALGIDGALLEASSSSSSSGVAVREMAGGCLCCTLSGPLAMAIPQLIRQTKPTRLFIEPSGLGHPSKLLELLQGKHLQGSLSIMAVVCLVDMRAVNPLLALDDTTYYSQIDVADILIGTFADVSTPEDVATFHAMASEQFPPKTIATGTFSDGSLVNIEDLFGSLLDLPREEHFTTLFKPTSQNTQITQTDSRSKEELWEMGLPARYVSTSGPKIDSVGWLFSPSTVFREKEMRQLCTGLAPSTGRTLRLKGIIRLEGSIVLKSIKYQGSSEVAFDDLDLPDSKDPSRIEIILGTSQGGGAMSRITDESDEIGSIISAILFCDFDRAEELMMRVLHGVFTS